MNAVWTRRDVLKTIAATVATPALVHGAPRPTVAIIGAGMAGVSTAWLLDGLRDVVLLESRENIGGNVRSLDVELDGHQFAVDLGAQFFHPGPYPVYTALLESLGLFPPAVAPPSPSAAFPASITIESPGEAKRKESDWRTATSSSTTWTTESAGIFQLLGMHRSQREHERRSAERLAHLRRVAAQREEARRRAASPYVERYAPRTAPGPS